MKIKKYIKGITSGIAGAISATLGVLGTLGFCFCSAPFIAFILAALGISSLALVKYNLLFLFTGTLLLVLSVFYFGKSIKK